MRTRDWAQQHRRRQRQRRSRDHGAEGSAAERHTHGSVSSVSFKGPPPVRDIWGGWPLPQSRLQVKTNQPLSWCPSLLIYRDTLTQCHSDTDPADLVFNGDSSWKQLSWHFFAEFDTLSSRPTRPFSHLFVYAWHTWKEEQGSDKILHNEEALL